MKNFLTCLILIAPLSAFASESVKFTGTTTKAGKQCTLEISDRQSDDYGDVIMRAKIGGKGIPIFSRSFTRIKTHVFKIVRLDLDNNRLISIGSEGDPELELFENNLSEITGYELINGSSESVICENLKKEVVL